MSAYLGFLLVGLAGFWLLLSGLWDHTLLWILGAISVSIAAYLGARIERYYPLRSVTRMLVRIPPYLVWLTGEIIRTNIRVLKCIWLPRMYPISPRLEKVPMTQTTRVGQTIYANSITLTPGTVTVRLEKDGKLLVHALTQDDIDELKAGGMDDRVTALEE